MDDTAKVSLTLHHRLWFECQGENVMGEGTIRLLREVASLGSLKKAATQLNMPYRGAWGRIRKAEKAMGIALLESSRYRQQGVTLTPAATNLLALFDQLEARTELFLKDCLGEVTSDDFSFIEKNKNHFQK